MAGGLKQLTDLMRPHTIRKLVEAGALDIRSPLAVAGTFPWLVGRGPSLGIVSQMHALTMGGRPALIDGSGAITWRELDGAANACARALERAGIRPKDKVGLLTRNGRHAVIVLLATQKLGIICCPLNTWAKPKELKAIAENVDPALVVYDTSHADQVSAAIPDGISVVHVGRDSDAIEGSVSWEGFIDGCSTRPLAPVTLDRGLAKVVIQTSGTTGTPKGAARDVSQSGLGALANLLDAVPYKREDRILCPAPLFHSFGLATMSFALGLGATVILPRKFDPIETLRMIDEHGATAVSLVPVMIRRIVSLPDADKKRFDLSSLRILLASGSAMSHDLKTAAAELFGEVVYDLYGSTEVGWVAIARPEDIKTHPASVGRPATGVEIAIFDNDGERVRDGSTGEIHVRSDTIFEGYTSGDSKAQRDGFVSIGDLGRLDENGFLYVESRSDDMVVIGGENVYPIEIEGVIESLPGVTEVSVQGIPDPEYGHVLAAFVVGDATEEEVVEACKEELASYKVPRAVRFLPELPRNATGKVLKRELVAFVQE